MERVSPSTTSRLPQGLALLIACAIGLAVSLGVVHLLLTTSPDRLFPRPFYFLKPVPGTYHASPPVPGTSDSPVYPGAAGADFAQIYSGARVLRAGHSPTRSRARTRSAAAGLRSVHDWLAVPFTALPYHAAPFSSIPSSSSGCSSPQPPSRSGSPGRFRISPPSCARPSCYC